MKKWLLVIVLAISAPVMAKIYYIDFTAPNDAANGTSKTTPWKHHPYMPGWSGSYTHAVGDSFIFKGGVVWDHTALPLHIIGGGSTGMGNDYFGVDRTWSSGASFSRPIFDGGSDTTCHVVVSIAANYVTIDNLELRGVWIATSGWTVYVTNSGIVYHDITISHCDIHNWRLSHSLTNDGAYGGIYYNTDVGAGDNNIVTGCHIHNEDGGYMAVGGGTIQTAGSGGVAASRVQTFTFNEVDHISSVFLHGGQSVHDNYVHDVVSSWDPAYHTNNFYLDLWMVPPCTRPAYFYKNKIINSRANAAPIFPICWGRSPGTGDSVYFYIFNNLVMGGNPPYGLDLGTSSTMTDSSPTGLASYVYIFNNTFEINNNTGCARTALRPNQQTPNIIHSINNFGIFDGAAPWSFTANDSVVENNNIVITHAQAAAMGYDSANFWSATDRNDTTVGRGANLSSYFKDDIDGNSRPAAGAWDVGAYEYATTRTHVASPPIHRGPAQRSPFIRSPEKMAALWQSGTNMDNSDYRMYDLKGRLIANGSARVSLKTKTTGVFIIANSGNTVITRIIQTK